MKKSTKASLIFMTNNELSKLEFGVSIIQTPNRRQKRKNSIPIFLSVVLVS